VLSTLRPCGVWATRGCLNVGRRRVLVWHNSSEELTSSSLLERPMFAPSIVFTASSLSLW
jgi:hypothetical protein